MGNYLTVRKRADKTGDTPPPDHPWPLVGVELLDAPDTCRVPTGWVNKAVAEGWATLEGARVEIRPGGPAHDVAAIVHQFIHADVFVIHALGGDVRYRITHQPDKYVADGDDDTPVSTEDYAAGNTRVDWFYSLAREV